VKLIQLFKPRPTITDQEVASGLHWLVLEGMASQGFLSITTSGFLAAFALALGANNLQIGILAAVPFLTQPLQIPAIPLIERLRRRKAIAVATFIPAQILWVPIALIPFFMDIPSAGAIALLLGLLAVRGVLVAVCNCAWNGWIRDLIPQNILGSVMARRLTLAAVAGTIFGLGAAFFADYWKSSHAMDSQALGYTLPLLFGVFTLAMASPLFMSFMPEPLMQPSLEPKPSLTNTIAAPFRDQNYKKLLRFLFLWGLAINLATPFFAVYMLQRLGLPLSMVIGFSILSQAFNIMFLRAWGRFMDQFGIKSVLSLCVSLYLVVILGWAFTGMPERYFLTIPLLVILQILAGIAAAGVTLATGNIGLKLAPQGQATSYLAGAGLAINLGAGIGPLLGGYFADFLSGRHLGALNMTGFAFLFVISFILGLITLAFLAGVREEGEVSREVVLDALLAPMRDLSRPLSTVAGLSFLSQFPYSYLRRVPIPGLDVAFGVTMYQIADIAKATMAAAQLGRNSTQKLAKALDEGLSQLWVSPEADAQLHGREVATQAARGAIHAVDEESRKDIGRFAHQAVLGVVQALRRSRVDTLEALWGASYGVIRGAEEVKTDLGPVAQNSVEAARELASKTGLPEDAAVAQAIEGAMDAANAVGPQAAEQVKTSLAKDLPAYEEYRSSVGEKDKQT
jgi:MFS family permease